MALPADRVLPAPIQLVPAVVSIDWLAINFNAPDGAASNLLPWAHRDPVPWDNTVSQFPADWERYITQPTDIRTGQFANVCYLTSMDGTKVATIWSDPHNTAFRGANWMQVQFANCTLPTNEWIALYRMFRAIGCEYTGISRIDLAADALEGSGGEWPKVVDMATTGQARYFGKANWTVRNSRGKNIGFEFGSRASNKFVRAYRKKREMKSKGVKKHIVDMWLDAFGFDPMAVDCEVNRFEVQLKGKEIRRYFPDERQDAWIERMQHEQNRVEVFASMAVSLFDFRTTTTGNQRARDARPVCAWDWSAVGAKRKHVATAKRAERSHDMTEHGTKAGLRYMFMLATVTGDRSALHACDKLAEAVGLWEYYERKKPVWLAQQGKRDAAKGTRTVNALELLRTQYGTGNNTALEPVILQRSNRELVETFRQSTYRPDTHADT